MTQPAIAEIAPFFIVHNLSRALSFYRNRLGFEVKFEEPADDPFFGIVRRGGAMIMFKDLGVEPAHSWDAYVEVPDPDALAAEFAARHVEFSVPLGDTGDGLCGFELKDQDGYGLFFGRLLPGAARARTSRH
jgi:catechol 2,3-dioxygenase-like lactoylglutathione lyase family enzyme